MRGPVTDLLLWRWKTPHWLLNDEIIQSESFLGGTWIHFPRTILGFKTSQNTMYILMQWAVAKIKAVNWEKLFDKRVNQFTEMTYILPALFHSPVTFLIVKHIFLFKKMPHENRCDLLLWQHTKKTKSKKHPLINTFPSERKKKSQANNRDQAKIFLFHSEAF